MRRYVWSQCSTLLNIARGTEIGQGEVVPVWTTPLVKEQVRAQSINQNGDANEVEVSRLQVKGKFLYSTSDSKQLTLG